MQAVIWRIEEGNSALRPADFAWAFGRAEALRRDSYLGLRPRLVWGAPLALSALFAVGACPELLAQFADKAVSV